MRFTVPGSRKGLRVRASRSWLAVAAAAGVALVGASCSGGDDSADDGAGDRTTTTTEQASSTTTTTQPQASGDGQQETFTIVENLAVEAIGLADELVQDPSNASEDDLERLREIYTDDSPTPPNVEERLDELSSNGQEVRAGPSGIFDEFMVHGMVAVDATTIRFNFCANQDQETVDANGQVVERFAEVSQGAGEARYVDGAWRFFGLHRDDETSLPTEPGQALSGFCDLLYGSEDDA
jgi:hypothetical protein